MATRGKEGKGEKDGEGEGAAGGGGGGGEQSRRREIAVACLTTIRRCGAVDAAKVRVQMLHTNVIASYTVLEYLNCMCL